jgi:hypothetical protein
MTTLLYYACGLFLALPAGAIVPTVVAVFVGIFAAGVIVGRVTQ